VYAGINVERSGLFTGIRGKQIAGRCVLTSTGPFPYRKEWQGLVATLEAALRLHRHQAGTLAKLDRYLHKRTGGMIGSLSHLIRAGAISAIVDGCEVITRELLDEVPLDHAAQSPARRRCLIMTRVKLRATPLPRPVSPFPHPSANHPRTGGRWPPTLGTLSTGSSCANYTGPSRPSSTGRSPASSRTRSTGGS
jgi:hypothetical protein